MDFNRPRSQLGVYKSTTTEHPCISIFIILNWGILMYLIRAYLTSKFSVVCLLKFCVYLFIYR